LLVSDATSRLRLLLSFPTLFASSTINVVGTVVNKFTSSVSIGPLPAKMASFRRYSAKKDL
jgi:hypothetical protein